MLRAGGTGIAPAPCGCGACCPSFREVHGSTRAPVKWPVLAVQSVRKFTNVHRRWGQRWGQMATTQHALFVQADERGMSQAAGHSTVTRTPSSEHVTGTFPDRVNMSVRECPAQMWTW